MKLTNWAVLLKLENQYLAPETGAQCLAGIVTGHPRLPDGMDVVTSRVIGKVGESVQTKSGSQYELGDVDPQFESLFPNARARLFATLPEINP